MKLTLIKYIKYAFGKTSWGESFYSEDDFRGNINSDLDYISSILTEMEVDHVLECLEDPECLGLQEELADFDIYGDKVKIWTLFGKPDSGDYSQWPSYTIDKLKLKEVIQSFIDYKIKQTPTLYLMLLSNNHITLQASLYENPNIIIPSSFPKYIITQQKNKTYKVFGFTNPKIRPLSLLVEFSNPRLFIKKTVDENIYFKKSHLEVKQIDDQVILTKIKKNPLKSSTLSISLKNFESMLNEWKELYDKQTPEIYFIQKDDGTVIVRESLKVAD